MNVTNNYNITNNETTNNGNPQETEGGNQEPAITNDEGGDGLNPGSADPGLAPGVDAEGINPVNNPTEPEAEMIPDGIDPGLMEPSNMGRFEDPNPGGYFEEPGYNDGGGGFFEEPGFDGGGGGFFDGGGGGGFFDDGGGGGFFGDGGGMDMGFDGGFDF